MSDGVDFDPLYVAARRVLLAAPLVWRLRSSTTDLSPSRPLTRPTRVR